MELVDLGEVFEGTEVRAFAGALCGRCVSPAAPSSGAASSTGLVDRAKTLGAKGLAWFKVDVGRRGRRSTSPLDKVLADTSAAAILSVDRGAATGDLILVVADEWRTACEVLGQIRAGSRSSPGGRGPGAVPVGDRVPDVRGDRRGR